MHAEMGFLKPVFIAGCERSGTTFLAAMLGNHPKYVTTPECPFKVALAKRFDWSEPVTKKLVGEAISFLKLYFRFLIWDIPLDENSFFKTHYNGSYSLRLLLEHTVSEFAKHKLEKNFCTVWFDHTPRTIRFLGTVTKHFPDARFIHIVRDGRGIASSIIPLDWGPNTAFHAAYFYKESVNFGLEAERTLGKSKVLRVYYEDLLRSPAEQVIRICEWLGIEFCDGMTTPGGFPLPAYTANQHIEIKRDINPSKIDSWKYSLGKRQIELFEHIAGDFLVELGYDCLVQSPRPPSMLRRRVLNLENRIVARRNASKILARKKKALFELGIDSQIVEQVVFGSAC